MKNELLDLALDNDLTKDDLKKMQKNHQQWTQSAKQYGQEHSVSWKDINMIRLEINSLLKFIKGGEKILDAGCANGFTTFEILKNRNVEMHGIDYCNEAIRQANLRKKEEKSGSKVTFSHDNLLNLHFAAKTFDKVMTVRALINLPSFKLQQKAITEIHRVLKPGGIYLMSEAFSGSLKKLNALRKLAPLPPLQMPEFNLYLQEAKLEGFLKKHFEIQTICRFSSIYYVGTRFVHYLTRDLSDPGSYENEFSQFFKDFAETPCSGDFGIQKLYVLKKR